MVLNSLKFSLSEKLDFSIKSEGKLLGRVLLVLGYFLSSLLSILCHSLLACRVSVEKSADSLSDVSL